MTNKGIDDIELCVRDKNSAEPYKRLPQVVFDKLADMIKVERHLLPVGSVALKWRYDDGFAIVAMLGDEPVGYTSLQVLFGGVNGPEWMELGGTIVHPDYRNRGINLALYERFLPFHTHRNIIATTTNVGSLMIGEKCNFVPVRRRDLPQKVWESSCCCPLSRTGAGDNKNHGCTLAHGEPQKKAGVTGCWFRVTAETAARLSLQSCAA